jgi:hypothetical protein
VNGTICRAWNLNSISKAPEDRPLDKLLLLRHEVKWRNNVIALIDLVVSA